MADGCALGKAESIADADTAAAGLALGAAIGAVDVDTGREAGVAGLRWAIFRLALVVATFLVGTAAEEASGGVAYGGVGGFAGVFGYADAG